MLERKHRELGYELDPTLDAPDFEAALDQDIDDNLLRLIFVACLPVLSMEARLSLTLRLLGGLTTDEIARALLAAEPTNAQRIVRAKKTLARERVPFEVPRGDARRERLESVLAVIYLVFNEGYSATAGDDWMRPSLCEEALRLGRVLAELTPGESEVHGLVALMEIQSSRAKARTTASGDRSSCSIRIAPSGTSSSSTAGSRRWSGRRRLAERTGRTPCRLPSPPATRAPAPPTTPTGSGLSSCTHGWRC